MTKRNTGVLWSVTQSLNADEKKIAQDNMGLDTLYSSANSDNAGKYVKRVYRDSNGKIVTVQSDTNSSFNYNDPSSAPINGVGVKAAIDSITVKVDDDTAALNRLMVTTKREDAIFDGDFFSGLKKVSPAGHTEYSYVSVNCGEGLYISDGRYNEPGQLCLSEATASTYGGIKIGYSSVGDNYAVQLDPTSKKAYVYVPTSTLVDEVTCSHDSEGDHRADPDRTITYLHQATNGQLSATFSNISIDFSRVHPETSSSYVAGEFVNLVTDDGGKLVPASIVAASKNSSAPSRTSGPVTGDKLMFCYGTSPEYWYSSTSTLSFNTSNTGKCLTQAGTWADFNNYSLPLAANGTRGGIQVGYSESNSGSLTTRNYAVKLSSEKAYVNVPWSDTKNTVGIGDAADFDAVDPYSFVLPMVKGSASGTNAQSFTGVAGSNLLSMSYDPMDGWQLYADSKLVPTINLTGQGDTARLLDVDHTGRMGFCNENVGSTTTPVYLKNGVITACNSMVTVRTYASGSSSGVIYDKWNYLTFGPENQITFSDNGLSSTLYGYYVPLVTEDDDNKVLTASYSNGYSTVQWATPFDAKKRIAYNINPTTTNYVFREGTAFFVDGDKNNTLYYVTSDWSLGSASWNTAGSAIGDHTAQIPLCTTYSGGTTIPASNQGIIERMIRLLASVLAESGTCTIDTTHGSDEIRLSKTYGGAKVLLINLYCPFVPGQSGTPVPGQSGTPHIEVKNSSNTTVATGYMLTPTTQYDSRYLFMFTNVAAFDRIQIYHGSYLQNGGTARAEIAAIGR